MPQRWCANTGEIRVCNAQEILQACLDEKILCGENRLQKLRILERLHMVKGCACDSRQESRAKTEEPQPHKRQKDRMKYGSGMGRVNADINVPKLCDAENRIR